MKVIIIKWYDERDYDSPVHILGVRESEAEADELIEQHKHRDDIPGFTVEEWHDAQDNYREWIERLIKSEKASPKKGGWVRKYHVEQMSNKAKILFAYIQELSGDMSFPQFYDKYLSSRYDFKVNRQLGVDYDSIQHKFRSWYSPVFDMPLEDYKSLEEHFSNTKNPEDIVYYKVYFDTKGGELTKEEFDNNNQ